MLSLVEYIQEYNYSTKVWPLCVMIVPLIYILVLISEHMQQLYQYGTVKCGCCHGKDSHSFACMGHYDLWLIVTSL